MGQLLPGTAFEGHKTASTKYFMTGEQKSECDSNLLNEPKVTYCNKLC